MAAARPMSEDVVAVAVTVDAATIDAALPRVTLATADTVDADAMDAVRLRTAPTAPESANGTEARGENPNISSPV